MKPELGFGLKPEWCFGADQTSGECDAFVGLIVPTNFGAGGYKPWASTDTLPTIGFTLKHDTGGKSLYAKTVETSAYASGAVGAQTVDTGIDIEDGYCRESQIAGASVSNDYTLGFLVDGDRSVDFYVNRIKRATITENLPTFAMGPALILESGNTTGMKSMYCDYIFGAYSRYPDGGKMTRYL